MSKPSREYYIMVIPELCMGCKSCEIACAVEHSKTKSIYTAPFETPPPIARIRILAVDNYYVPMRCQHCKDAPCMAVCPTSAISRTEDGFVVLNQQKCIGCLMCATACPFGHPKIDSYTRTVVKCDFCYERIHKGVLPACVEACPTSALRFGTLDELMEKIAAEKAEAMLKGMGKMPGHVIVFSAEQMGEKKEPQMKVSDVRSMYGNVRWE